MRLTLWNQRTPHGWSSLVTRITFETHAKDPIFRHCCVERTNQRSAAQLKEADVVLW